MKRIIALSIIVSLYGSAYADGLLPAKEPQAMEIKMPDGTMQKGFIKDGVFVPVLEAGTAVMATVQPVTNNMTEDDAAKLITIETSMLPLDSKLKKRYAAYKITVNSNYPHSLNVISGNVSNAIDGTVAYQVVKGSVSKSLFGLLFVPILTVPITAGVVHSRNKKAEGESVAYPGQVPMIDNLHKGENFQFSALVPLGQKPQVRISFKDKNNFEFIKTAQ